MEQHRIQARMLELGVGIVAGRTLGRVFPGTVETACVYTGRVQEMSCDATVLVTARLPRTDLADALAALRDSWSDAGLRSVRTVGDAHSPGTIAAAVWDGRRFAEDLDDQPAGVPFRRDRVVAVDQEKGLRGRS